MVSKIFFFLLVSLCDSYKILVYSPTLSRSHMISNGRIADALANDGHNVTLLETHYDVPLGSFKAAHKANIWQQDFEWNERGSKEDWALFVQHQFGDFGPIENYQGNQLFHSRLLRACKHLLEENGFVEKIRKEKFDVYIGEQLDACGSGLSQAAGIPVHLWVSSCPMGVHVMAMAGLPLTPSYVPAVYENDDVDDQMSLRERFWNLVRYGINHLGFVGAIDETTEIYRQKFGSDFPDLRRVIGESPLILASVDEFLDFPRPISPRVVNIGGLGLSPSESSVLPNISEPLASELKKGKNGVVFVSFGSTIPTAVLPLPVMENIIRAVGRIQDFHFIVKIDKEDTKSREIAAEFSNIYPTHWVPQTALLGLFRFLLSNCLAHPRLRLFVTHGGYNGLLEAAYEGIPLLSIGVFGDQPSNALVVQRNGWGRALSRKSLLGTSEPFEKTLREALNDPSLPVAAKRVRNLVRTKPLSANERLIRHIRFLEANGGRLPELRPHSIYLSAIALYNIDLFLILFAAVFGSLFFAIFAIRKLLRLFSSTNSAKTKRE